MLAFEPNSAAPGLRVLIATEWFPFRSTSQRFQMLKYLKSISKNFKKITIVKTLSCESTKMRVLFSSYLFCTFNLQVHSSRCFFSLCRAPLPVLSLCLQLFAQSHRARLPAMDLGWAVHGLELLLLRAETCLIAYCYTTPLPKQ